MIAFHMNETKGLVVISIIIQFGILKIFIMIVKLRTNSIVESIFENYPRLLQTSYPWCIIIFENFEIHIQQLYPNLWWFEKPNNIM
jgi:hypothetical protein